MILTLNLKLHYKLSMMQIRRCNRRCNDGVPHSKFSLKMATLSSCDGLDPRSTIQTASYWMPCPGSRDSCSLVSKFSSSNYKLLFWEQCTCQNAIDAVSFCCLVKLLRFWIQQQTRICSEDSNTMTWFLQSPVHSQRHLIYKITSVCDCDFLWH